MVDRAAGRCRVVFAVRRDGAYGRRCVAAENETDVDASQVIAAAYRKAIAAADPASWKEVARLLAEQPGREAEAEAAYREAIAAGDAGAWDGVGVILARQPGREAEAESAFKRAIAARTRRRRFTSACCWRRRTAALARPRRRFARRSPEASARPG